MRAHPNRPALSLPEPFNDAAFVSRLQKLLSLLASEQPGEADAARRKLLEHLAHHRLSLTDVGARLGPRAARQVIPGFEEMSLERELHIARIGRQEAEGETLRSRQRIVELSQSLQEANIDASRAIAGQARARVAAAAGWLVAGIAGALILAENLHQAGVAEGRAHVVVLQGASGHESLEELDPALRPSPGEQLGTVLVQDLAVRLTPSDDAGIRAFLNRGMRVVVERQIRIGVQNWLLIRSVTGSGWVRGGDVLH